MTNTDKNIKYSDLLADWLVELGYTACFFVAGGNIMHILESCSRKMRMVPVVHEVAAGIAAEYYNESGTHGRAFALVTAGPGLTNIVTAFGGAWLESREMLVIGGQVKTADLSHNTVRQRGIQEINGVDIVKPISVRAELVEDVLTKQQFFDFAEAGSHGRKGPVFIELPLDIQGRMVSIEALGTVKQAAPIIPAVSQVDTDKLADMLRKAERPVFLLGGGVDREVTAALPYNKLSIPFMVTWNGADRLGADNPLYFGRPNTWGQRYANLLLQQSDLVVALGARLGMQQTGFNWQEFVPVGKVVHVDCDKAELTKGHPRTDMAICGDANLLLQDLVSADLGKHDNWLTYCREVRDALPLFETNNNKTAPEYLSPFQFVTDLSVACTDKDIVIPCSSGGAFTTMMQAYNQKAGQIIITNKGLASMGYGLSGAIGAALAGDGRRTVLVEGDGGFSQNVQEIGTAAINKLNLKIFIYDDSGYASIRMTQSNYFSGRYVGCDTKTGLGMPNWEKLFSAWDVPVLRLKAGFKDDANFKNLFDQPGVAAFLVPIDPQQTYFPKITSRVTETGGMASNPLHKMSPDLDDALLAKVGRYLPAAK